MELSNSTLKKVESEIGKADPRDQGEIQQIIEMIKENQVEWNANIKPFAGKNKEAAPS